MIQNLQSAKGNLKGAFFDLKEQYETQKYYDVYRRHSSQSLMCHLSWCSPFHSRLYVQIVSVSQRRETGRASQEGINDALLIRVVSHLELTMIKSEVLSSGHRSGSLLSENSDHPRVCHFRVI